jgi:hypothetical protein
MGSPANRKGSADIHRHTSNEKTKRKECKTLHLRKVSGIFGRAFLVFYVFEKFRYLQGKRAN